MKIYALEGNYEKMGKSTSLVTAVDEKQAKKAVSRYIRVGYGAPKKISGHEILWSHPLDVPPTIPLVISVFWPVKTN